MPHVGPDGKLQGYVGCTFDITEVQETEAALAELERGKNEFLAMLAHELRNPLSGVRNASLLLRRVTPDPIVEEARQIIDRQATHMVRMVDDLLDVTRVTHGKIRIESQPVDLAEVLRRSIEDTAAERAVRKQELQATIPQGPWTVNADAVRLTQVFDNLLNNASKFTPVGGRISVSLEGELTRGAARSNALVRVRDNGAGIEPHMLPRIFDLFVQENRPGVARGGIGLGLTLAKRLIELQGGRIEARSEGSGHGSEFIVRVPLIEGARRSQAQRPASSAGGGAVARRVLIVDDNRDSAQSLKLMLTMDGHHVENVPEGALAVEAAARMQAEVVLLDIGLPDMDGYDVARALRSDARTAGVLIIAATGYGRAQDREKSRRAGIDEHMTKPVDIDRLMARLAELPAAAPPKRKR
jgi:nitrogen-specific signal transduction histidine kinase/ActR/RegA family two-component response regulator